MSNLLKYAYALGEKLALDEAMDDALPDEQTPDKLVASSIAKLTDRDVPDLSSTANPNKDSARSSGFGNKIELDPNAYVDRLG